MSNLKLITTVTPNYYKNKINYNSKILLLGSCFSTNIGQILESYSFNIVSNPFGVLYNPESIYNSVKLLTQEDLFTEKDIRQTNTTDKNSAPLYCSNYHHSTFRSESKSSFLENANSKLIEARAFFKESDTIIITLGTAWIFRENMSGAVVSNCHKRLATDFTRERLSLERIVELLSSIMELCRDKSVIFTISPIRHIKDGLTDNNISKGLLLQGVERIIKSHDNSYYFPSYEIMLDELRDYRFYAEDLVHPSPVAIKYIFNRFKEFCICPKCYPLMEQNLKTFKHSNHIYK